MNDNPTCRACGTPMYVGLGTQPPVCDNRTCSRYVPSLSERKAGITFPRPSAVEPEPLEDAPLIEWSDLGGFAPPFLCYSGTSTPIQVGDRVRCKFLREPLIVERIESVVRVHLTGSRRFRDVCAPAKHLTLDPDTGTS